MHKFPLDSKIINQKIREIGISNVGHASIREISRLANGIEKEYGIPFIHMEMGIPGIPLAQIGLDAEIEALKNGVSSVYPPVFGIESFKTEASRFLKLFADINFSPKVCLPVVGSMEGSIAAIMVTSHLYPLKRKTLFIDPGFPVQKLQCKVLGNGYYSFDLCDYRGPKLKSKLEEFLQKGDVANILYSNPNNPAWVCLTNEELEIIGTLADTYDVMVIEDLAYFGMDFREDIGIPGVPPYQPSIKNFTENCILLISCSKIFSYAGQRLGILAISDKLYERNFDLLEHYYLNKNFGHSMVYGALYAITAGTAHSAQYAMVKMLKAVNDGEYNFVNHLKEYAERASILKKIFIENGFYIAYDSDTDKPIGDGFYFTVNYPGFTGVQLLEELLYYGISTISLDITGSNREGLRICVSQFSTSQKEELIERLKIFRENHV